MRKVYVGLFSSVDGVVEGPNEWVARLRRGDGAGWWGCSMAGRGAAGRSMFTEWAGN